MNNIDASIGTFSPETVQILGDALDEAWRRLEVGRHMNGSADGAKALIAQQIISMARQGERDRREPH